MAGFATTNTQFLTRTDLWDKQIKDVLTDELMGWRYVRMLDFPDGDRINIPSVGQMFSRDYTEGSQIQYDSMDTGNFQFSINEYKSSATYITNKAMQDFFYASELQSMFVPKQARALAEAIEEKILRIGPATQTASNLNLINTAAHRMIGSGPSATISVSDFAKANFALDMANVPQAGRVAIIHPSAAYTLGTQTNLINLSFNPSWEGIVRSGHMTGMKFITNILGFDVYTSQRVRRNTASETINSVTATAGYNNLFFSTVSDVVPFVGSVRQQPKVDSEYNKDFQRWEFVTTCRYDVALFRPENLVNVITDQVV